jgi:hypothetical protein
MNPPPVSDGAVLFAVSKGMLRSPFTSQGCLAGSLAFFYTCHICIAVIHTRGDTHHGRETAHLFT